MSEVGAEASGSADSTVVHLPVSVVIATLGEPTLDATIATVNSGDHRPAEILICVPEDAWGDRPDWGDANVHVMRLPFRGQVRQRAAGFVAATQPYVLQLDADLILREGALRSLIAEIEDLGPSAAVAPVYVTADGRASAELPAGVRGFGLSLANSILHGAPWGVKRMGAVGRSGQSFGVDPDRMTESRLAVQWLSGGCVVHRRENLVTQDFFPFPGKAYAEDLVHSRLLQERGISLWVTREAQCVIEKAEESHALPELVRKYRADFYACRANGIGVAWRGMRLLVCLARDLIGFASRLLCGRSRAWSARS